VKNDDSTWGERSDDGFPEALAAAQRAEVVVLVLGLSNRIEGEEGAADKSQWHGDRIQIGLPRIQRRLLDAVAAKGKPMILVLLSGSALAIAEEHAMASAVLLAWYPGQAGGEAVGEALFGGFSPAGRLPVTIVKSVEQLPPFVDYAMEGRTYRYMKGTPLYPFGYGLSYASFAYADLKVERRRVEAGGSLNATVVVKNTGNTAADEVVQLYLSDLETSVVVPRWQLSGFRRIRLQPGESLTVAFTVEARQMALIDDGGHRVVEPGRFRLHVGGRQPDDRSAELAGTPVLSVDFEVTGSPTALPY
jgi:beta-glucosidase